MPDIEYIDCNLKEAELASFDFRHKYSHEEHKKAAKKELNEFGLQQKQVPANVLMKSDYEQVSDKNYLLYFDDYFYRFYFFNKNKKMLNYFRLIESHDCELGCPYHERTLHINFDILEISQATLNA